MAQRTEREKEPPPHSARRSEFQSFWYYVPIVLVIGLGYIAGGTLAFGVQFLNLFPLVHGYVSRLTMMLFGCGMLGATLAVTRWWALDIDEALQRPEFLPNPLDWFGYATTIVGGGVTGVILYTGVRAGIFLTVSGEHVPALRLPSAIVISFSAGLSQFKIHEVLNETIKKLIARQRDAKRDIESTDNTSPDPDSDADIESRPEGNNQQSNLGPVDATKEKES